VLAIPSLIFALAIMAILDPGLTLLLIALGSPTGPSPAASRAPRRCR
jgi:ABC-type dipeptide/oligopeptide/nickel transport system permease subunit